MTSLICVIIFRYSEVMGRSFQPRNVYSGIIGPYANRNRPDSFGANFGITPPKERWSHGRVLPKNSIRMAPKMGAFFDFPTFGKSKIANGKENVIGFAQMLGCVKKCYFLWWSLSGLVFAQLVAEIWHGLTVLFLCHQNICSHHFRPHTGWCDPSVTPLHRLPPLLIVMVQNNWCDFAAWLQKGQILRHVL